MATRPPNRPPFPPNPTPPNGWRGPGAAHRPPPPPPPPIVRKPCGLCNRIRRWVGLEPRR